MRKRFIFIGGGVLLLLVGVVFWFSSSEQNLRIGVQTGNQTCKGDDLPIPLKRLSDENSLPFLIYGRPLSSLSKREDYDLYRQAVARFPDVKSCLAISEREKQIPDLNLIDWDAVKGSYQAEVCLFRVFSSIRSVEGSAQWLKNQGFRIGGIQKVSLKLMRFAGEEKPGMGIDSSWDMKKCGAKFGSMSYLDPVEQSIHLAANKLLVGVLFSDDGNIINTSVVLSTKP